MAITDRTGRLRAMSARVLRRLACDAGIVMAATDAHGSPLDLGRRSRTLSAALRRALHLRDRSCRFPGCDATRNLHAHHVVHWAEGGPTNLANLVLVCAHHHRFVHEHGWQIIPAAAGTFRFGPPDADALPTVRRLPGVGAPPSVTQKHRSGRPLRPIFHAARGNLDLGLAVEVRYHQLRIAAAHTSIDADDVTDPALAA